MNHTLTYPIILFDGKYRTAIPASANLVKITRWLRVCGYRLRWRNGFILEPMK